MKDEKIIKVLFIEDDEVIQIAFKRFIKENNINYDYTIASSILEAKNILMSNVFDVIIADYMLTDGTSFEIFEMGIDTPIIISTKSGSEEVAVKAMKLGAYDYIIKDLGYEYLKVIPLAIQKSLKRKKDDEQIKMLTHAISHISDSVLIIDDHNQIVYVNESFCDTYGYTAKEVIGKKIDDFIASDSLIEIPHKEQLIEDSLSMIHNLYHKRKNGSLFPVSLSKSVLQMQKGKEVLTIYVIRDITDYLQAEEKHLMALFSEWSPAPLLRVNKDNKVIMANKEANNVFGSKFLYDKSINDLIPGFEKIHLEECLKKNCLKYIYSINIGKKTFDFVIRGISELKVAQIYGFDVTEKTRLQNELIEKQRLAAIGQTIASITHCMKNIFTVLKGGNYLLKEAVEKKITDNYKKSYEILSRAINQLYLLLMNMLDYSKKQTSVKDQVKLVDLFTDVTNCLHFSAEQNKVKIKYDIAKNTQELSLDYQLIYRALLNLGCNAIDAMQDGGLLTFLAYEKKLKDWEKEFPKFSLNNCKKHKISIIEVRDNGAGIPKEHLSKIFDPFFSTKGSRGTGLGLTTVKQFIEDQGDKIFVKSEEGKGTSFYLVII